jgi:tRNA G46 methylase TrmB
MFPVENLSLYPRVVIELGMGDGRLLDSLATKDQGSLYVGIELDEGQFRQAISRRKPQNLLFLNGSFEEIIQELPDSSVDRFIAVLPDPEYVDERKQASWRPIYKTLYAKLKNNGTFQLVTETTDELLQPVSDSQYSKWTEWLLPAFVSLGFVATLCEGAPAEYTSRCLDQFRGDPQRIRLVTLELGKR